MADGRILKSLSKQLRYLGRPISVAIVGKGGVGKSSIAINSSVLLAQAEANVVLIDADENNRSVERWNLERGLSDLSGWLHVGTAWASEDIEAARDRTIDFAASGVPSILLVDASGGSIVDVLGMPYTEFDVVLVPVEATPVALIASLQLVADAVPEPEAADATNILAFVNRWSSAVRLERARDALSDRHHLGPPVQALVAHQDAFARWLGVSEYKPDHAATWDVATLLGATLAAAGCPAPGSIGPRPDSRVRGA